MLAPSIFLISYHYNIFSSIHKILFSIWLCDINNYCEKIKMQDKDYSNNKIGAVILGNGPSLRGFDFKRLSKFDVFGMNAAYRYWYEIDWFPQYYSCLDLVVGASHRDNIIKMIKDSEYLGIKAFLLRSELIKDLGQLATSSKIINFDLLRNGFELWKIGPVTTGSHTCAWASIIGYKDIFLLGIDCNYVEIVPNAELVDNTVLEIRENGPNPNYFFDSYQMKGDKYNIPNPRKDLHLNSWCNIKDKISPQSKVFNANLASKVDCFPYVRLSDVEKGGRVPIYSFSAVSNKKSLEDPYDFVTISHHRNTNPETLKLNLNNKEKNRKKLKLLRSIVAFDAEWQSFDNTEQNAFLQAVKLLPNLKDTSYFGFPWATLIESLRLDLPEAKELLNTISIAKPFLKKKKNVITVCQHADMLSYQSLFAEAGVSQLFWTNYQEQQNCLPDYQAVMVYPMPVALNNACLDPKNYNVPKKRLFSFIEEKSEKKIYSITEQWILEKLDDDPRGLVIKENQWNFSYILGKAIQAQDRSGFKRRLAPAHIESWRILQESYFSLCPASSETNTLRLWESIGSGSIPVLISDSFCLPGNRSLWEEAIVFCPPRLEDILALPSHLESLSQDDALLKRKRQAMRQLWLQYGPDCLIYDIQKLFLSLAQENAATEFTAKEYSYGKLLALGAKITSKRAEELERNLFILGCSSRVIADPVGFLCKYKESAELRLAYKEAMNICNQRYSEAMLRNLNSKGIAIG